MLSIMLNVCWQPNLCVFCVCVFVWVRRAVASGASEGGGGVARYIVWTWIARTAVGEAAQRPSEAAGGLVAL